MPSISGRNRKLATVILIVASFVTILVVINSAFILVRTEKVLAIGDRAGIYQSPDAESNLMQLVSVDGSVYILWDERDFRQAAQSGVIYSDVLFGRSTDGGRSYGDVVNLTENSTHYEVSYFPSMATVGSDNIFVVWRGYDIMKDSQTNTSSETYFSKSTDAGRSFTPLVNLSQSPIADSDEVGIVTVNATHLYVVWTEVGDGRLIYYRESTDGGASFKERRVAAEATEEKDGAKLISLPSGDFAFITRASHDVNRFGTPWVQKYTGKESAVVDYDNVLYVTWLSIGDNGANRLYFSKSEDRGSTFSKPIELSDKVDISLSKSMTLCGEDTIFVVWNDYLSESNTDVFISTSTDGGVTFSTPINLSNTTTPSHNPKVVSSQNCEAIYVSWAEILRAEREAEINPEIMLRWSLNGGQSFSSTVNISNSTSENSYVAIEVGVSDGGELFSIAWMDKHGSSENEYQDIFYRLGRLVDED